LRHRPLLLTDSSVGHGTVSTMTEFFRQDLSDARFEEVDFTRAWFRNVYFVGATLRGAWLEDVDIDGEIRNVRINGVDVGPLVEAELNRRHPERTKLTPNSADGFRAAWAVIEQAWPSTVERARRLPPELLHERVDDEWSFIETLRHLLFATDAWLLRAFLGRSDPYSPLDLPNTEMEPDPSVPNDVNARPALDEVLQLRAERMAIMRDTVAALTDNVLAGDTNPIAAPGYPTAGTYRVSRCLQAVINEEWLHHLYAERDLAVLESRRTGTVG
jgi:DinB superfamily/Pentapeptide repeats (8 copies)